MNNGLHPELAVFLDQHHWLFNQLASEIGRLGPELAMRRVEGLADANTPLGIVTHVAGVTRGYVLGIALELGVTRNRDAEFLAVGVTPEMVAEELARLEMAMASAFAALKPGALDLRVRPSADLYGLGEPREMSPRASTSKISESTSSYHNALRTSKSGTFLASASRNCPASSRKRSYSGPSSRCKRSFSRTAKAGALPLVEMAIVRSPLRKIEGAMKLQRGISSTTLTSCRLAVASCQT